MNDEAKILAMCLAIADAHIDEFVELRRPKWHLTKHETVIVAVALFVIFTFLVGTIIATKAPCSWRPAWRPECQETS